MSIILAIDDDPDILRVIELVLDGAGHRVVTSLQADDALPLVLGEGADVAVLDVEMPGASGYDVLRALRQEPRTNAIPVLFLSARVDTSDRVRGLREGADDYLTKPFDPEELVLRVERLLARRPQERTGRSELAANLRRSLAEKRVVGDVRLGRYQAKEIVGEGGMGVVFRGWDPQLKRPVALKVLTGKRLKKSTSVARFLTEAVTTARFSDPHIVAVHDVGDDPETPFIAMEYVNGPSLLRHLGDHGGRLDAGQVACLGQAIAQALAAAHGEGIVHRDVKPENVLLGRNGSIKLTDFGIASLLSALAGEPGVAGTPGYIAPEVIELGEYSSQGDLFSLGVTLYQCTTGMLPCGQGDRYQRLLGTLEREPEPVRQHAEDVPEPLEELILELLAKTPEDRPGDAAAVAERLAALVPDPEACWRPPISRQRRPDLSGSRSTFLSQETLKSLL